MTTAEQLIAANRAARVALIIATLTDATTLVADVLADIDDDIRWFRIWTRALGIGAGCPSRETRAAVREAVQARAPYQLTDEDRALLAECEADDAWDRHVDGKIAEGRGM